ncbi:hypothetical protein VF14_36240 [Nostoc linckia z18]|jgi:uncharacterized protein|uniref:DUF4870 domain-containing protein n=2 Tax=Nostoc linckia TaxID=92942 RepID=A0A9Q5Z4A9_NOSLI|nr:MULTISPECIES: DUF4870 domain-containing protein [Nostoc]MDZ8015547.1 DUF4870 domain-containing protein [Nostoc sp. ZfuVER08]PHK26851.1 hypothetical protein VF12_36065 [Nostoc linckia z15]PHK40927.1 hypothetical protein VF13_32115 [Nostoc linckia z16]MBC1240654.1 DUF4870 domain-containing protein [Nostoc sp. 2RC]PHJ57037.1 hypothetical protein VF02_31310 [Nostoc linckia z1]
MREKPKQQVRVWAMLCHLSALLAWILVLFLVFIGIPLYLPLNLLAPLMIWRCQKAKYPWIDFQGKESLNFQISLTFYTFIFIVISLFFVLTSFSLAVTTNSKINEVQLTLDSLLIVLTSLISLMLILQLFLVIFAAIKAYNGEHYRYPLTIRVLR